MGFTIDYDIGILGGLVIALLVGVGVIALIFFLAAAKRAHDDMIEEEHDKGHDVPLG